MCLNEVNPVRTFRNLVISYIEMFKQTCSMRGGIKFDLWLCPCEF